MLILFDDLGEEFRNKIEETANREKEILKAQKKYLMDNTQKGILDKSVAEVLEMLKDDPVYNKVLEKVTFHDTLFGIDLK